MQKPNNLMSLAILIAITVVNLFVPGVSQTIEYNSSGRRIAYPNGEVIYIGKSGDAILEFGTGRREYGSWAENSRGIIVYLPNRKIYVNSQAQSTRISGYCILRGQVVPDNFCY